MKRREWLHGLGAALFAAQAFGRETGIIETSLNRSPRVRGGLGGNVTQAWLAYQAMAKNGLLANDLLALTGRNLNGQDASTIAVYRDLWVQMASVMACRTPEEAGVELVTIVAHGSGGQLIPREVTSAGEIPLPIFGMTWGHSVTHGLVAFRRAGTYRAFAKDLLIRTGKKDGPVRALRLLTWLDCGNSSITLPPPVEVPGPERVICKTEYKTVEKTECLVIEIPGEPECVEVPVPGPERCYTRVEYQDRVREICVPAPAVCRQLETIVLEDSRRQLSGPGQYTPPPGVVTPGQGWAITAAATWWNLPKQQPAKPGEVVKPPVDGQKPPPLVPPAPGDLPANPPTTPTPPVDDTLAPNPGGVTPVAGPDGAVNTPGATDPSTLPPGTVVVPIPAPGSAADNAANMLPG